MSSLVKIRSERDQMSAIERRIGNFILDNAHLLRDYSSQQLADALGISQSSVVKFSQKLGFKGYPDLKYSVGESIARSDANDGTAVAASAADDPQAALAESLWQCKAQAERETRLINPQENIQAIAETLDTAGKVFVIGLGEDGIAARAFAQRLSLLGILALHHCDPLLMAASVSTAGKGDLLLVFSEFGLQHALGQLGRRFRDLRGRVVSVTRHTPNPLRAHASLSLLVSAHDKRAHVAPLLYQSALQHLLDVLFVVLCERSSRIARLEDNLEHAQRMPDS